ncbi:hypothetical protein HK099_007769 [Clydaea vesicula]|uniref:Methyltransferase FkbM domain-containing protein n=1 Tax=Clydaea vesicula TaxID=447962 RepID=A0AAD5TY86_9FUNG|nr:hypothetical protein HK099_007769 [Clydaea vesicula]
MSSHHYGINNPTFLDIGSNIGWFSMILAKHGFEVISFEASKSNGLLFRGLSDKEKKCYLISDDQNLGDGIIKCYKQNQENFAPSGYKIREHIDLVRLDDYVQQDIFLLKIDVEGFEPYVLDGATLLFKHYKVNFLMTEIAVAMMQENNKDPLKYIESLLDLGFECSSIDFTGPYLDFKKHFKTKNFNLLDLGLGAFVTAVVVK